MCFVYVAVRCLIIITPTVDFKSELYGENFFFFHYFVNKLSMSKCSIKGSICCSLKNGIVKNSEFKYLLLS